MHKVNGRADELLTELYTSGKPFLDEYPWEFEGDRWVELLVCGLVVALDIGTSVARHAVDTLRSLEVVSPQQLARGSGADEALIERVLIRAGLTTDSAKEARRLIHSLAKAVCKKHDGHLQRYLRKHGEKIAHELGRDFESAGVSEPAAERIAVLWLQNVANIPLLLPGDPHIAAFCKAHRLSNAQLLETADRLGLNVAVLDDLLALEAFAANEAQVAAAASPVASMK